MSPVPRESEQSIRTSGTEVIESGEPSDMGSGIQTRVLEKMDSQLHASH